MITLNLELQELNGILTALGQMPYAQVAELIDKVHQQAIPQVQQEQQPAEE